MAMMPPAIVVATIPTVVVAAPAMTMSMAAFDLNHCPHRRRHPAHKVDGSLGADNVEVALIVMPPGPQQSVGSPWPDRLELHLLRFAQRRKVILEGDLHLPDSLQHGDQPVARGREPCGWRERIGPLARPVEDVHRPSAGVL